MISIKLTELLYHSLPNVFEAGQLSRLLPERFNACGIEGLALDSREVKPGDLFIAYPGGSVDSRDFIQAAIQRGAKAVLAEGPALEVTVEGPIPILNIPNLRSKVGLIASYFYGNPSGQLTVIGVTGTNGKTSSVQFIASALNTLGHSSATIGTLGIGKPQHLTASSLTTPSPLVIQKSLAQFVRSGIRYVAMEVSSHAIDQDRINGVDIDYALLTNISRDHLDYHKTAEAYQDTKARLFLEYARRGAILNLDDPFGQKLQKVITELPVSGFSLETAATAATEAEASVLGAASLVDWVSASVAPDALPELSIGFMRKGGQTGNLDSQLLGMISAKNLLATLAVLLRLGIGWEEALLALSKLSCIPGRLERCQQSMVNEPWVVIDYAHTPDALRQVLENLRSKCVGKLWCVFGCGGDRDVGKRQEMGQVAEEYSDCVVITNDNPRSESPERIVQHILEGFRVPSAAKIKYDRGLAIQYAIAQAGPLDRVLVAGKGHEDYQLIGDKRLKFRDIDAAWRALSVRRALAR